ncbi:MAG: DUF4349 domain-containing protein [Lachnospiraceae bacterium]|jgi:hypothetical protein|nr:DUF4349 domain-containing protein [Lachnospiraceae bacterium]
MKKRTIGLFAGVAAAVMLSACGSSAAMNETAVSMDAAPAAAAESGGGYLSDGVSEEYGYGTGADGVSVTSAAVPAGEAAAAEEASAGKADNGAGEISGQVQEKLIRRVNMEVETQAFDALVSGLRNEVETLGGYVENFSVNDYYGGVNRDAQMTARVPSVSLDDFLNSVEGQSNVVYRNETVEDVTLQYVDLDTHKKALLTERERLMELLSKAEEVADIIEIESRLSEVRYQIESLESQLRVIDNQVTYSTVYLSVREVELYSPAEKQGMWEKISDRFINKVYRMIWRLEEMVIEGVASLPFLLGWLTVIVIVVVAGRLILRRLCRGMTVKFKKWNEKHREKLEQLRRQRETDEGYEIIPENADDQRQEETGGRESAADDQGREETGGTESAADDTGDKQNG